MFGHGTSWNRAESRFTGSRSLRKVLSNRDNGPWHAPCRPKAEARQERPPSAGPGVRPSSNGPRLGRNQP
jgi:hypothetical protein